MAHAGLNGSRLLSRHQLTYPVSGGGHKLRQSLSANRRDRIRSPAAFLMQLRGEVGHRRRHSPFKPGITDHIVAILQRGLRWLGSAGLTEEAATPEQPGYRY